MVNLHKTDNPINRHERVKINENWDRIESGFSKQQLQINTNKTNAESAVEMANQAKVIAEGIDGKATEALETAQTANGKSNTAVQTANTAKQVAEGIDGKVNQAMSTSATAETKSDNAIEIANGAKSTAENVQDQFSQVIAEAGSNNPEVVASRIDAETGETFVSLPQRLDQQHKQLTAQLDQLDEQKASKTDVNTLATSKSDTIYVNTELVKKRDIDVTIKMGDLSQEVRESMTGNSVAVVGVSSVNDINLRDGVTLAKFKDVEEVTTNNNLVNPYTTTSGGFYHPSTGLWVTNQDFATTDYFKIEYNKGYYLYASGARAVTFWDRDYNFVSGLQTPVTSNYFDVPNNPNIMYARAAIDITTVPVTNVKVTKNEQSVSQDNEFDYRYVLNNKILYEGTVDINKINLLRGHTSVNLFNSAKRNLGWYYSIADGSVVTNTNFDSTDFILVRPNEVFYKHISSGGASFFDKNKNFLQGFGQNLCNFITVPNNKDICYMSMPIRKSAVDECMIIKTTTEPTFYVPYDDTENLLREDVKIGTDNLSVDLQNQFDAVLNGYPDQILFTNQYTNDINIQEGRDKKSGTSYWLTRINRETFDGGIISPKIRLTAPSITSGAITDVRTFTLANDYLAVINAGVFNVANGLTDGLLISDGVILQDSALVLHPDMYTIGIKSDGMMSFYDSNYTAQSILADGCTQALVGFIPLIQNGQIVSQSIFDLIPAHNTPHPRQVIGQLKNGDYIIATFDGRVTGEVGVTLPDAARILLQYGVQTAFNLDGGGSTQTFIGKKRINRLIENRKVANVIVFERQL